MEMQSKKKRTDKDTLLELKYEVAAGYGMTIAKADELLRFILGKINESLHADKDFCLNNICTLRKYMSKETKVNTHMTGNKDVIVPSKVKIRVRTSRRF